MCGCFNAAHSRPKALGAPSNKTNDGLSPARHHNLAVHRQLHARHRLEFSG
jgi:hypothetical protein